MARPGEHRLWFRLIAAVVKPFLYSFTRRRWLGIENIPRSGGVILVANHVTVVDPLTLAHAVYDGARRIPRYLAKAELFKAPVVGTVLRKGGQIPVQRQTRDAAASLRAAEASLARGECVIIFPEGTCTRDPNGWPMTSRTGVARLALTTSAPVVPVAHWGAHRILGYKSKRPHLLPPKRISVIAGPPLDLSAYDGVEPTNDVLREVTDLLMHQVMSLLGEIRDEQPPTTFYDPRREAAATKASSA